LTATSTRSVRGRSAPGLPRRADSAPLGSPLFVLNLKTYPSALGSRAVEIATELADAGRSAGVAVAIAPATPELARVVAAVPIAVLAQHVDPGDPGPSTGFVPVPALSAAGARGSLVNHSEHPLPFAKVAAVVGGLEAAGLAAVVCARNPEATRRLAALRPPYVAIEPPELIGGPRAVSTAKPEVVVAGVRAARGVSPSTHVLCGAGVKDRGDVRKALELGSEGVLVASAVALAPRPRDAIEELLSGF
jgi:triosephosphate isomerase (TIM)